jgi:hypothetical protein
MAMGIVEGCNSILLAESGQRRKRDHILTLPQILPTHISPEGTVGLSPRQAMHPPLRQTSREDRQRRNTCPGPSGAVPGRKLLIFAFFVRFAVQILDLTRC